MSEYSFEIKSNLSEGEILLKDASVKLKAAKKALRKLADFNLRITYGDIAVLPENKNEANKAVDEMIKIINDI